jgi:uncharacterized protein
MGSRLIVILYLLFSFGSLQAKEVPSPNKGDRAFVNDISDILSPSEEVMLISKLKGYFDSTSTQIVILLEPSLQGDPIFDYSIKVAREWGIGEKEKDNGILIFVATADRKTFIQVGDGLEGAIPDMIAGRVVDYVLIPAFKQGKYFEGIDRAIDELILYASGEHTDPRAPKNGLPTWLIIVVIIIIIIIFSSFGNNMNRTYRSGTPYLGGYIGGSSFGGGGGFGGGGFGGFGGGGFSGGGAGGSW